MFVFVYNLGIQATIDKVFLLIIFYIFLLLIYIFFFLDYFYFLFLRRLLTQAIYFDVVFLALLVGNEINFIRYYYSDCAIHDLCILDNFIRHRHCFLLLEGFRGQPPIALSRPSTLQGYEHQKFTIF